MLYAAAPWTKTPRCAPCLTATADPRYVCPHHARGRIHTRAREASCVALCVEAQVESANSVESDFPYNKGVHFMAFSTATLTPMHCCTPVSNPPPRRRCFADVISRRRCATRLRTERATFLVPSARHFAASMRSYARRPDGKTCCVTRWRHANGLGKMRTRRRRRRRRTPRRGCCGTQPRAALMLPWCPLRWKQMMHNRQVARIADVQPSLLWCVPHRLQPFQSLCLTLLSRHLQIRGDALHIANCGDSRAVLCCAGGTAAALTVDHVPSLPSEAARIAAAGGFVCADGRVGGTLALSRALGDAAYKQAAHLPPERQAVVSTPDVMSMQMHPGQHEFLLLACDGLWDVRSNQAAVDFVRPRLAEGIAPAEVAAQLCSVCIADDTQQLAGLGCDNVSVVLIVLPASREHSSDGEVETPSSCEQVVHRRGSLKRHAPHAASDEIYDGDSGSDGEEEEEEEIALERHAAKRQTTRRQTARGVTCEG